MADDGHERTMSAGTRKEVERRSSARQQYGGDLQHEVEVRRAAVKRTAAALEDRLRERSEQLGEAFDKTRDRVQEIDRLAHRYRYALIGGAIGLGFGLARRGGSGRVAVTPAGGGDGIRYLLVERPAARPGLLRSLLGGVTALALRQGVNWLGHWLERSDDPDEPRLLPPARPR